MIISVGYEIVHNLAASMNMTAKKYAPKSQTTIYHGIGISPQILTRYLGNLY